MHKDVVKEAQGQAEDHGIALDEETGNVKSSWEIMGEKASEGLGNIWEKISTWFSTLDIGGKLGGLWEKVKLLEYILNQTTNQLN